MGRRATSNEELIPCRPTSSSPHRCRRFSTTRSRPTIGATITLQAADKAALLAAQGAAIRGLVQGGGTVTPTSLLDALPALEIISVFGVGYDGVPVDYCRKRGLKVTNTPDVLTDDVADVAVALDHDDGPRLRAAQSLRDGGRMEEARTGAHDEARRQDGRHPRARPHRQGHRASASRRWA